MSHRFYPLGLHTKEWERLKKLSSPIEPEGAAVDTREEYFNALNERSRQWIKHWPDSAESVKEKLERQKKKQRIEDIALVDAFRKSRKHENTQEAVKRAKQIIFDHSCYGRQLISAVYESRAIEEREAQIAFQKEIKLKEAELEKDKIYEDSPLASRYNGKEMEIVRRLAALECVKFNQEIEQAKKEKIAKLKAEQIKCESVDVNMVKQIRETRAKKKAEIKQIERQEMEEYEAVRSKVEKHRKMCEDRDNALIEVYKKEQERTKCKMDSVLKKIIEEERHGDRAVKFYNVIDELQKNEKKKYDDFVEKAITIRDERIAKQEMNNIKIEKKKRVERCKIAEENRIAGENHKLYLKQTAPVNKCVCDTQTILVKPESAKALKKIEEKDVRKPDSQKAVDVSEKSIIKGESKKAELSFLQPRNKLVEELKKRAKEPSAYTGTSSADEYFAQQASEAIHQTKYKYFARKVVDEYLKVNCLNPSDLSIPNY